MSCCTTCGAPVAPVNWPSQPALLPPSEVGTRVVTDPHDNPPLRPWAETDEHTALTRGLSEYLSLAVNRVGPGGKIYRFQATYDRWAEPNENAVYPYAVVFGDDDGKFDPSAGLSPEIAAEFQSDAGNTRQALYRTSEYEQMLNVQVTATDPIERSFLTLLTREAMTPASATGVGAFMYGLRLWLPHYYGALATYEPIGYGFVENSEVQMRRDRTTVLKVKAKVGSYTLTTQPIGTPTFQINVGTQPLSTPHPLRGTSVWAQD